MRLAKLLTFVLTAICLLAKAQQKTDAQLAAQLLNLVPDNSVKFITPKNLRQVIQDGYDARISIYGNTGIKGILRYNTLLTISNDKDIVHKKYVDDAIAASSSGVTSFNGRSGAVVPVTGDYTFSQIGSKPTTLSGYGITDPVVLTSGSYSNPSWITAVAWSKMTSTPTTRAGYGITDAEAILTFSLPLIRTVNAISIQQASGSLAGYLSSTDWTTFNSKQPQLSGTGFVKASGTTISYDNSTYLTAITGTMINTALGYTAANDANVVHKTGNEPGIAGNKGWNGVATFNNDVSLTAGSLYMNDGQYVSASSGPAKISLMSSGSSTWFGGPGNISFGSTGTNTIDFNLTNPNNGTSFLQDFGPRKLMQNGSNPTGTASQKSSYKTIWEAATYTGSVQLRQFYQYQYASASVADSTSLEFGYGSTKKIAFTQTGDLALLTNAPRILDQNNNTHLRFLTPGGSNSTSLWLYNGTNNYSLQTADPVGYANLTLSATPTSTDYGFIILSSHVKVTTDGLHPSTGTATLSSGTVTINTTRATTSGKIFVTGQNCSSCGSYSIGTRVAGTSFVINSTNVFDASTVAWWLVE